MFSEMAELRQFDHTVFDYLYDFFERDFVTNETYLNQGIWINPRSDRKDEGKELDFWHLVTKNQRDTRGNDDRYLDTYRAERLPWVKKIIENHNDDEIKLFYFREKNNKVRLYLWAHDQDFVVILQKLGRAETFLVTSFYIMYSKKRRDFDKRFEDYCNGTDERLNRCEWF